MRLSILFSLLFLVSIYAQTDTSFTMDVFSIHLTDKLLEVKNPAEKIIFSKEFNFATSLITDLDNDGVDELVIIDNYQKKENREFSVYIFSTADSFYQAAMVPSGYLEPYLQHSDEYESDLIITGNPDLNYLNENSSDIYYPLICWKYEGGELFNANKDLYDIFINENDALIDYLDDFLESNEKDCTATLKIKNLIASIYLNYLSAGESIMAQQFLKSYYFCDDTAAFKSELDNFIKKED